DTPPVYPEGMVGALRLPPRPAVAHDVHPVDPLEIGGIAAADHIRQYWMHQVVGRPREHAVGLEGRLARSQEALHRFTPDAIVVNVADQPGAIERAEHVPGLPSPARGTVLLKEPLRLLAGQDVPGEPAQKPVEVEIAQARSDLCQILE